MLRYDSVFYTSCHEGNEDKSRPISVVPNDRTTGQQVQNEILEISLKYKKKTSTARVVKQWNRLLPEVVESPSSETFKTCLDTVLTNLTSDQITLKDVHNSLQPQRFCYSANWNVDIDALQKCSKSQAVLHSTFRGSSWTDPPKECEIFGGKMHVSIFTPYNWTLGF